MTSWLTDCKSQTNPSTVIVLIGNKLDLSDQRKVSFEEASKFAEENNIIYIEASAKTGKNVEDSFLSTATKIVEKIKNGEIDPNSVESGIQVYGNETNVSTSASSSNCSCILL